MQEMMNTPWWGWAIFGAIVAVLMALDLGVFHRKAHEIKIKESLIMCGIWVMLAFLFNMGICLTKGGKPALEFLTGYLIEYSLSVDNLFVFILIFSYFKVPKQYQHEVLFWGILGALVMRILFIMAGIALINRFHWMFWVFGAFLIFTGIKMVFHKEEEIHPEKNIVLRLFGKIMPIEHRYHDGKFFIRRGKGGWAATPLFIALLMVESTDVIFALDSIPAIFAITVDPFIVYTSNVFAILGLRSLYFALSGLIQIFHYLHYGIGGILVFVGLKMSLHDWIHVPIGVSLGVIVGCLALAVVASLRWPAPVKVAAPKDPVGKIE